MGVIIMQKYTSILNKLAKAGESFTTAKPDFYTNAEVYLNSLRPTKDSLLNQGLYHNAAEGHKNFIKSFKLTNEDFMNQFMGLKVNDKALHVLIDSFYSIQMLHNEEIRRRSYELNQVLGKFLEVMPNVHIYECPQHILVFFVREGLAVKYTKNADFLKWVIEDTDIYLVYKNGSIDCICEDGIFSSDCTNGLAVIQKGYRRLDFNIDGKILHFRVHTMSIALAYGFEMAKHLLGRFSLLTVDHIDGVANNNDLRNLRIITRKDNTLLKTYKDRDVYDFLTLETIKKKLLRDSLGIKYKNAVFIY
jgi:hypothetical protein